MCRVVLVHTIHFFLDYLSNFKRHHAQWFDNALFVAGGLVKADGLEPTTESCWLNKETDMFDCNDTVPALTDYFHGVSFVVPSDYCKFLPFE